jgi:hypothetical protein
MIKVAGSGAVKGFAWDEENQNLYVKFKNNAIYVYLMIPRMVFNCLKTCESTGKFFNEHIKKTYNYKVITDKKEIKDV